MKFDCPSCGAPSQFESALSFYFTCRYCRTQVFRNEQQLEVLGTQADLPADMSPLQLFSEGQYEGQKFKILGRIKQSWAEGYWNEWYLGMSDGSEAWLAEAQGQWAISRSVQDLMIPKISAELVGQRLDYRGMPFVFSDFKESTACGYEGEIPFPCPANEKKYSLDLLYQGIPQKIDKPFFLTFESRESSHECGHQAFFGKYVHLAELKISSLRKIDGWI